MAENKKRATTEALKKKNLDSAFRNKVKDEKHGIEFLETINEFTGLVFHCPCCDEVFHLHIAQVKVEEK